MIRGWQRSNDQATGTRRPPAERAEAPSDRDFRVLAENAIFPVALIDSEGTVRWVSSSVERFFGWSPAALVGRGLDSIVAPESLSDAYAAFNAIDEAFEIGPWGGVGLPLRVMHADGSTIPCEVSAITTKRTGLPWYVVHIRRAGYEQALDLAIEAMAEGAAPGDVLARLVDLLEQMVPGSVGAIGDQWSGSDFGVIAGRAGPLLVAEPTAPWAEALATGIDVVRDLDELSTPVAAIARAHGYAACWVHPVTVPGDVDPIAAIVIWRTRCGRPAPFTWTTVCRVGQLLRLTLQWDRSHSALQYAATHDPLTGLANRQAFLDRLDGVARQAGEQTAVLYVDLDRFKPVNDHLGHPVGDRVLEIVANRLRDTLRPGDLVARFGGDEFAVLCERLASPDAAVTVAARLREVVRRPVRPLVGSTYEVCLDASIGIAHVNDSTDRVLTHADDAMRAAKTAGRGRSVRYGG